MKKHLVKGKAMSGTHCPLALALKERFPGIYIRVERQMTDVGKQRCPTSEAMRQFIHNFDSGLAVRSITFTLPIQKRKVTP